MENGKFRMWSSSDGLRSSSVRDITEDPRGVIYVATTGGITMIDSNMRLTDFGDPELYGAFISHMRTSRDGLVYGVTNPGDVFTRCLHYKGGKNGLLYQPLRVCR